MRLFRTKEGLKVRLKVWNFDDISRFTAKSRPLVHDPHNNGNSCYSGFSYFGPCLAYDLSHRTDPKNNYAEESNLSPLELQADRNLSKVEYHHALVALVEENLIGILVCQWIKFRENFWHYKLRYIDVHNDFKNQGVGTHLVKALNRADFIKGKIIYAGMLSTEGHKYIRKVIKRELKADDYALVFEDYDKKGKPAELGIYGGENWEWRSS